MLMLEVNIETRVIIGISAMLVLFVSFMILFISSQRKKLQYHKELQSLNEQQQKTLSDQNALLEQRVRERTAELSMQTEVLQTTLNDLKATQMHLVQREKMASLGELTAGIAHEIQNPLNFVNNFAEVSSELLQEFHKMAFDHLPAEFKAEAEDIYGHVIENLDKINHHGKRADSIVKGMLQHSRISTGQKEFTDINELADEYLRLSYHGLRAKDKTFNAVMYENLGRDIPLLSIIPQDIGRVLLNLYNNAFYSVTQKHHLHPEIHFEPSVTVSSEKNGEFVLIRIRDNGTGIPKNVLDKIYQPFFTTKPTGQGTGLGLSLSYDIIKAHGGELKVESKEGEGAEFTISLPIA
ncbi:two-component sensor histidine kinase [Flavihumibacter sp. R14]|nr:two-component sensor histidine kinase [Flavihumibacter soli]